MEKALKKFWSGFLKAYDENTVRTGQLQPEYPYITYNTNFGNFDEPMNLHASIWDKSTSWDRADTIMHQINDAIGPGGLVIREQGELVWIKRLAPFAQRMADPDPAVRRIYLNIEIENLK